MWHVELYDRRYDWLVVALLAIPPVWLFYGFDAAFVSLLAFALVGGLKPLVSRLTSRIAAGVFAAGVVLLLSPLLRYVFYNGYCFEGVWSPGSEISRYLAPHLCGNGLFSAFRQDIWFGPLRDLVMPVAGLGLMVLAWLDPKQATQDAVRELEEADDYDVPPRPWHRRYRLTNWGTLGFALLLWIGGSYLNYRAIQNMLEQTRQEEIFQRAWRVAAAAEEARRVAAEEARRIAAEKAAKRVELKWLQGSWVAIDGLSAEVKKERRWYCATDSGVQFISGGRYNWYDEEGKYQLDEDVIRFTNRVRTEFGEPDAIPENLEPISYKVERSGNHLMIEGDTYARC